MLFNKSLDANAVVFGITDHFNDNDGHHQYAYTFNTVTLETEKVLFISGYTKYTEVIIDATDEQKEIARDLYSRQYTKIYSLKDYLGSTVVLKRSRKAKNGIELKVNDIREGGYNRRYNNYEPDMLLVECPVNGLVWVSASCATVVKADSLHWIDYGYTVVTEETVKTTEEEATEEAVKVETLAEETKANLYWITFTAYNEVGKPLKTVTRLCDSHSEVVKVSLALQAKLKYEGLPVDFMGYDIASYHNTSYQDAMLTDAKIMTYNQVLEVLNLNPCKYARFNDIGLKGLYRFYSANINKTVNQ